MTRGKYAVLSDDGRYRYTLGRLWNHEPTTRRLVTFIMLNPSTADAEVDDPTIRRCVGFARKWGYDGIHVVNLYALRATRPVHLWEAEDPVGPQNDTYTWLSLQMARERGMPVVAAWGAGAKPGREQVVIDMARLMGIPLQALKVTKDGKPGHPLYLKSDSQLVAFP